MKRDGHTISLWQNETSSYKAIIHDLPAEADVVIVGGGMTGLSTAMKLQRQGKMCVLIEAQEIGFGTTGGTTAHLNTILDTPYYQMKNHFGQGNAKKVAQLTKDAIDLIEGTIQEYSIDCGFRRSPAYFFSQDKDQSIELDKIVMGTQEVGIDIQYSTSLPIPIPFDSAAVASHQAMVNPHFFLLSGGGPTLTDSQGIPWTGAFVNSNGDLTVDLRSNIAAESRAKLVYENLLSFTDDPLVKESLRFLMTREVAHFQMFEAALESIQPNFPPGILQSDPRHSNKYFNMSQGEDFKGPWNEGKSTEFGEEWKYIDNPIEYVHNSNGLLKEKTEGSTRTEMSVQQSNKTLSAERRREVDKASTPNNGELSWQGVM